VGTHAVDHLMERVSLVEVKGPPIEYIVNLVEDRGMILVLVNNGDRAWRGEVVVKGGFPRGSCEVEEWWEGERCPHSLRGERLVLHPEVPEFGFRIYSIRQFRRTR